MGISLFLKSLMIGFLMCLPLGPIAVLCIHRTLKGGRMHGLVSGLGAATADALYSLIAVLGLGIISNFLVKEQMWVRVIGGILLIYIGVRIFLSQPAKKETPAGDQPYFRNFISAFVLTLTNPLTFWALAAIFAGLGLVGEDINHVSAGLIVAGIFVGATLWWFILSNIANMLRGILEHGMLKLLNRIIGILIVCFGVFVLVSLVIYLYLQPT